MAASKRGAGKLSPSRLATAEKRAAATSLRVAGRTFKQIGQELGVTTGRAYQLVDEALYATLVAPADALRKIELARLDELLKGVYGNALRGDYRAIETVLKIMARTAKLTGLDRSNDKPTLPTDAIAENESGDCVIEIVFVSPDVHRAASACELPRPLLSAGVARN